MQITEKLSQEGLTRQEQLIIWMRRNNLKNVDIARSLGVGSGTVSAWLEAESISTWRHRQLTEFGIPVDLLPPAVDIPPGPRRIK